MQAFLVSAATAALLVLALPGESLAQQGTRGYGGGYDPQTVETVAGEVVSVDKVANDARGDYGIHVLLKTGKGEIPVHLGPSWFVDRQTVKVALHDVVEVTGSRVVYAGKPALIAAEVRKGGETLRLRSRDGLPLWSGSGVR